MLYFLNGSLSYSEMSIEQHVQDCYAIYWKNITAMWLCPDWILCDQAKERPPISERVGGTRTLRTLEKGYKMLLFHYRPTALIIRKYLQSAGQP